MQGWGGPKKVHGELIEGSFHAHQVPLTEAKTDPEERAQLQQWLSSYDPHKLFPNGEPNEDILQIIPEEDHLKLGQRKEAYASYEPLNVPNWMETGLPVEKGKEASCMKTVGEFLHEIVKKYVLHRNQRRFVPNPALGTRPPSVSSLLTN